MTKPAVRIQLDELSRQTSKRLRPEAIKAAVETEKRKFVKPFSGVGTFWYASIGIVFSALAVWLFFISAYSLMLPAFLAAFGCCGIAGCRIYTNWFFRRRCVRARLREGGDKNV